MRLIRNLQSDLTSKSTEMRFCPVFITSCADVNNHIITMLSNYCASAHTVISKKYCLCILLAVPTCLLLMLRAMWLNLAYAYVLK